MPGPVSETSSLAHSPSRRRDAVTRGCVRRVPERVVEQVAQELPQAAVVSGNRDLLNLAGDDTAVGRQGGDAFQFLSDYFAQAYRLRAERLPRLHLGQQQEVVDDAGHPGGLGLDCPEGLGQVLSIGIAPDEIQIAPHDGQRTAQLVRCIGDELLLR